MDSPQELGPVARRRQARRNRLDMCKFIFIEYCYNWWIQNICSVIHVLDKKYLLVQKYFLPLPLPRVEALTGGGPRWAVAARQPVEWYWPDMGLIEGTPGQGTFTQYRGSNWHKYIKQKAYLCSTLLFCQFQHSMLLGTVRSARGWQKCVPARAVSAWRRWTLAVVSGQWPVVSGLLIKSTFPPTAAFQRQVPGPPPPQPLTKLISNSISSILFYVHFLD